MKPEVVVITGGSAGVGRATVQAFAKRKALIGIIARDRARLEVVRKEAENLGGKVLVLPLDVANAEQIEEAADLVEKELGPIDIWINNAMVSVFSPAKEMTAAEYKRVTEVTYLGYVYGTLSALKRMLPRDKGIIIQVGSALAYRGIPLQSAYSAAKHAIQGFTESVRSELIHDASHVKISMVQLPAMNTPQFNWVKSRLPRKPQPVPPIYQPEIAADAIVWATTHYRRQWYVGGSTVFAIIGNKIAPGIGDWYLARKGYEAQQYDGMADQNRPNNLYESVPGNFGVQGDFDRLASNSSFQFWISRHLKWYLGVFSALFLVYLCWLIFR
jgi:short-subunit dehydrogenase